MVERILYNERSLLTVCDTLMSVPLHPAAAPWEATVPLRSGGVVYLDGRFLADGETPQVSLFDRAYLFGDSVFETLRAYRGMAFREEQHLQRLGYSARALGIDLPVAGAELRGLIRAAMGKSGLQDAYVRVTVSRGEGGGTISPAGCDKPVLSIIVRPRKPYPAEAYARGIPSAVVETRRVPPACIDSRAKCGNYLPSILARRELDRQGMIEGVQLAVDGHVVCGTVSNLFLVDGARLRTPDLASGCLPGITRAAVLELAPSLGLEPREERLTVADLSRADEMFFTNSLMECLPVARIGEHAFGEAPGPRTRAIHGALTLLIDREVEAKR
jgi:branched-chain amino acid aminotransferase